MPGSNSATSLLLCELLHPPSLAHKHGRENQENHGSCQSGEEASCSGEAEALESLHEVEWRREGVDLTPEGDKDRCLTRTNRTVRCLTLDGVREADGCD